MELYEVVRQAISPETLKLIKDTLVISKDAEYAVNAVPLTDTKRFGDHQCPDSWVSYSNPVCEALLLTVQPILERVSGKRLHPTYSYCRIYWNGAILDKHKDRPACQYSASVCIDIDPEPWAFYMGDDELILNPGDLVCYKGMEVVHWRKPYTGKQQIQIFVHFVDADDRFANQIYDGRPTLGFDNKLAGERTQAMLQNAVQMHQQGRITEAQSIYETVLKILPKQADALHLLGVVKRQLGNPEESIVLITKAIEISPENYNFYFNRAMAELDATDPISAAKSLDKAVEIKSDFQEAKELRAKIKEIDGI